MEQTPKDFVTLRPWQEIATELCNEISAKRVLELSNELDKALEAQESSQKKAVLKL